MQWALVNRPNGHKYCRAGGTVYLDGRERNISIQKNCPRACASRSFWCNARKGILGKGGMVEEDNGAGDARVVPGDLLSKKRRTGRGGGYYKRRGQVQTAWGPGVERAPSSIRGPDQDKRGCDVDGRSAECGAREGEERGSLVPHFSGIVDRSRHRSRACVYGRANRESSLKQSFMIKTPTAARCQGTMFMWRRAREGHPCGIVDGRVQVQAYRRARKTSRESVRDFRGIRQTRPRGGERVNRYGERP